MWIIPIPRIWMTSTFSHLHHPSPILSPNPWMTSTCLSSSPSLQFLHLNSSAQLGHQYLPNDVDESSWLGYFPSMKTFWDLTTGMSQRSDHYDPKMSENLNLISVTVASWHQYWIPMSYLDWYYWWWFYLDAKLGHISITFLPTPYIFCDIRAIQTLNRPNMPKKYSTW